MKGNYRLGEEGRGERGRERESEREWGGGREREAYGFLIDADWLFRVQVEHLLHALRILESDKPKAPAIYY